MPLIEGGFQGDEPAIAPDAGISAGGARDEELPAREDPSEVMQATIADMADEPAVEAEPDPEADADEAPTKRRKRSTTAPTD